MGYNGGTNNQSSLTHKSLIQRQTIMKQFISFRYHQKYFNNYNNLKQNKELIFDS